MQNIEQSIARGHDAQRLKKDELLADCFTLLEQKYVSEWMIANNVDDREYIHALMTALTDVRNHLDQIIQSGVLAEEQLRISRS